MKAKWLLGQVIDISKISTTKLVFSLAIDSEDVFMFEAGQFVTMDLPLGDKRRDRWRSYSVANIPNEINVLQFAIGFYDGGLASHYFFETMRVGDKIKFKGPEGGFVLPKLIDEPIVMIGTGTGIVPFISMLRSLHGKDKHPNQVHLIYGSRYEEDLLFLDELLSFEKLYNYLQLDIVLSRQPISKFSSGYVHDVYQSAYKSKSGNIKYLICGWSAMIDQAVANLMPLVEQPMRQIKYELYG